MKIQSGCHPSRGRISLYTSGSLHLKEKQTSTYTSFQPVSFTTMNSDIVSQGGRYLFLFFYGFFMVFHIVIFWNLVQFDLENNWTIVRTSWFTGGLVSIVDKRLNCFLFVAKTKRAFSNSVHFIRKGSLKCFQGKHVQEVISVFKHIIELIEFSSPAKQTSLWLIMFNFCCRSQSGVSASLLLYKGFYASWL